MSADIPGQALVAASRDERQAEAASTARGPPGGRRSSRDLIGVGATQRRFLMAIVDYTKETNHEATL